MEELEKINHTKDDIKRLLDKLYNTTSINVEAQAIADLISDIKKIDIKEVIDLSNELDVFGKCVMHYKLPIEMRLNVELAKTTEVPYESRISYWKDYKSKIRSFNFGPEEEYNKIILMALILHVPIKDEDANDGEN